MENKISFLQEQRLAHGYKQEDLAQMMNVARCTISFWELGKREPTLRTCVRLAEIFQVPLEELVHRMIADKEHKHTVSGIDKTQH